MVENSVATSNLYRRMKEFYSTIIASTINYLRSLMLVDVNPHFSLQKKYVSKLNIFHRWHNLLAILGEEFRKNVMTHELFRTFIFAPWVFSNIYYFHILRKQFCQKWIVGNNEIL